VCLFHAHTIAISIRFGSQEANRHNSPDPINLFAREWKTESSGETVREVVDVEADSVIGHGGMDNGLMGILSIYQGEEMKADA